MDISPIHISDSAPSARTIVLCFDGTGNEYNDEPTNVIKLYSLLRKDSRNQLCYYQVGVPFICSKSLIYL